MSKLPERPRCPICEGEDFDKQAGKIDSKWGVTAHKVTMLICKRCGYVLLFSEGRSIWDFD